MGKLPLTVIVPAFNEAGTIACVLTRVAEVPLPKQIVVVDDGSTDGTGAVIAAWEHHDVLAADMVVVRHNANCGKGAAIRTGLRNARGIVTVIQDADLEYDPSEIPRLAAPIFDGEADVVYGSRYLNRENVLPWTAN